jgi:ABC-type nitrate/sulfonate/bicarbonate transport system substrate-binding protein
MVAYLNSDENVWQKYGIHETNTVVESASVLGELESGKVQFVILSSGQPEAGALQGIPLKWLAVWSPRPDFQLIADSSVKTLSDLKGKKIGIAGPAATSTDLTNKLLQTSGLSPSDVHEISLGSTGAASDAFLAGSIDAFPAAPPVTQEVLAKSPGAHVLYDWGTSTTPFIFTGLAAYMPWVEAHKAATENVLRALQEGISLYKAEPAKAESVIVDVTKVDPATAAIAYKASLGDMTTLQPPTTEEESLVLTLLAPTISKAKTANPSSLIDPSYLEAVGG